MLVLTITPSFIVKQTISLSYYFAADYEQQYPGHYNSNNFGPYIEDDPIWTLRVRELRITLWPGTGKIDADMYFDLYGRPLSVGIEDQRLWADSYENDPTQYSNQQIFFAPSGHLLEKMNMDTLSVYTGAIWDDGYSVDFTFFLQN